MSIDRDISGPANDDSTEFNFYLSRSFVESNLRGVTIDSDTSVDVSTSNGRCSRDEWKYKQFNRDE